jgi:hypothetical protein
MINNTGLRREELSRDNLKVDDLQLSGEMPYVRVRKGKGGKDRIVYLTSYIRERLKEFTTGKNPSESVFNLAPKSISMKINYWAHKAGVPSIHTHSLRHKFATDILDRGGNIRALQQLMGHQSLSTTECYLAITDKGLKNAIDLLDNTQSNNNGEPNGAPVQSTVQTDSIKIYDLKSLVDPINLCQVFSPSNVEEIKIFELPVVNKASADKLQASHNTY